MFMDCCANLSKCLLEEQLFEFSLPDGDLMVSDLGRGSCPSAQPHLGCCVQLWLLRTAGTGRSWSEAREDEEGTGGKAEGQGGWNQTPTQISG